jgi:hypothetical protein
MPDRDQEFLASIFKQHLSVLCEDRSDELEHRISLRAYTCDLAKDRDPKAVIRCPELRQEYRIVQLRPAEQARI